MGIFDTLRKASGGAADSIARQSDRAADAAEQRLGGRLSQEQQNNIAKARIEAQRLRDYAEEQRRRNGS